MDLAVTASIKDSFGQAIAIGVVGFIVGLLSKSAVDITAARAEKTRPRSWWTYAKRMLAIAVR